MNAVEAFERAFAEHVGAKHAIALANGTCTLHTALVALGVGPGDKVAVPSLTMASTTIAVLHAGATPMFVDVDPDTWLMDIPPAEGGKIPTFPEVTYFSIPVSLYGLHQPHAGLFTIDDAAQTLRPHGGGAFTSYSFQSSKVLPLGEGGMLVTDDRELAQRAREFASLGYHMPDGHIDKAALKSPTYARHHTLGYNYRMSSLVAERGYEALHNTNPYYPREVVVLQTRRLRCAALYREAIQGCDWLTPQHVPDGWTHDYWTYAVACDTPARLLWLLDAMERHGGERPYPAWRLTYHEPALRYLNPRAYKYNPCPVAESLQSRLCQFQTNNLDSAKQNALALRKAIDTCT